MLLNNAIATVIAVIVFTGIFMSPGRTGDKLVLREDPRPTRLFHAAQILWSQIRVTSSCLWAQSRSLNPNARGLDHVGPLLGFAGDELAKISGCHCDGQATLFKEALFDR